MIVAVSDVIHPKSRAALSKFGLLIAITGAAIQLLLGTYYLAMAHAPHPHHLPVGVVASPQTQASLTQRLEADGSFKVFEYRDLNELTRAIKNRSAYGGVVITDQAATGYIASAAAPSVANLLRSSFNAAYADHVAGLVKQATQSGQPVPAQTLVALTAPPKVVDVVPLPRDDSAGSSLGFLIQALSLGASIASLALGRLGRHTRRSTVRGFAHASLLVVYALASSAVGLLAMAFFGVGSGADHWSLFWTLSLISLSITASTAAAVALVGAAGSLVGGLYFTLGLVISGSSIAPEMLPTAGRIVGQLLPPGAGATLVRNRLYFPDAPFSGPLWILIGFSAMGLLVILVTNMLARAEAAAS